MLALHLAAASEVVAKNHYGGTAIVGCAWPDPTLSTVWDGGWQMHVNVDHWKAFHHVTIDFPLPIVIRDAWAASIVAVDGDRLNGAESITGLVSQVTLELSTHPEAPRCRWPCDQADRWCEPCDTASDGEDVLHSFGVTGEGPLEKDFPGVLFECTGEEIDGPR